MLFSSTLFVFLFLPVVLGLYFLVHPRLRNTVLLLASLLFYAWGEPVLSLVLLLSIVANWLFGIWVGRARKRGGGRGVLVLAIVFNLLMLVAFKYADWLWGSTSDLLYSMHWIDAPWSHLGSYLAPDSMVRAAILGPDDRIRLPLGVSFFSFQATSYVIDIWRGDVDSEKNPVDFAMYKAFFPQLIAGPIVRYRDVHVQIHERSVTVEGFAEGIRRFVLGLGKKMLIANVCAEACDKCFAVPAAELSPSVAWLGIVCYTLQIYFDFSGYSDMAIGLARMFGFRFLENFDYPYVAKSITDFWRRWHISLSSWFRDYLYIPLGGNRGSKLKTYRNLLIVFFLCGLWHGASFAFVVWGLYHGMFLAIERAGFGDWLAKRPAALRHAYLILVVMVGWVFFRAPDLTYAMSYLSAMFGIVDGSQLVAVGDRMIPAELIHHVPLFARSLTWTAIVAGVIGSTPWLPAARAWVQRQYENGRTTLGASCELGGTLLLAVVFVCTAMELVGSRYNPFIYFRF